MNELSALFLQIADDSVITLERGKTYHVRQDDSFSLEGYYCTNTARKEENPNGARKVAIFLEGKRNITIDGNGATLLIHGKMTPFLFNRCENVTVRDLTVDYACPTMSEYTIVSNEDGVCVLKVNEECLFRIKEGQLFWHGEDDLQGNPYWEDVYHSNKRVSELYDPKTQIHRAMDWGTPEFEMVEELDAHTLRVELKDKSLYFPAGHIVETRNIIRDHTGGLFQRCKNLLFENLRIKFMHGLGMTSQFCENVTFRNCDFTAAAGRIIASTADFFQFSGCRGQLTIEGCRTGAAHDDCVNVHGTHLCITEHCKEDNSVVVRFMHYESWGFQAFEVGDRIELIKWNTLIPFGEAVVTGYERLNDTDIRLYLDRPLPELELGKDVVENADWTPNLLVRDCVFGPSSGRGVLCTTRGNVLIEQNRFENLNGPSLVVEDDCNFWFESGYTKQITFRDNLVINSPIRCVEGKKHAVRYSPKVMDEQSEAFVHEKLVLTGNIFECAKDENYTMWLSYLAQAYIENNTFSTPYRVDAHHVGTMVDRNNGPKKDA